MAAKRKRDPKARPFAEKLLSKDPDTTYTDASKQAKAQSVHLTPTLYYMIKKEMGIGSRRGRPPKGGTAGRGGKARAAKATGSTAGTARGNGRRRRGAAASNGNPLEQLAQHVRELTRERDHYRSILVDLKESLDSALA